jgi:hypothetical protein
VVYIHFFFNLWVADYNLFYFGVLGEYKELHFIGEAESVALVLIYDFLLGTAPLGAVPFLHEWEGIMDVRVREGCGGRRRRSRCRPAFAGGTDTPKQPDGGGWMAI